MLANILISVGLTLLACGIFLRLSARPADIQVPSTGASEPSQSSREENVRKGMEFEEWVVSRFDNRYFRIKDWRGDKGAFGRHVDSSRLPDLELEFRHKEANKQFAVECKWRKNYYKDGIEWSYPDQIECYRSFASEKNLPVFIVIGLAGTPGDPNTVFVVPLHEIDGPFLTREFLNLHRRSNPNRNFFLDLQTESLR